MSLISQMLAGGNKIRLAQMSFNIESISCFLHRVVAAAIPAKERAPSRQNLNQLAKSGQYSHAQKDVNQWT